MMDDYMFFAAGVAMAVIIFYALSEINRPPAHPSGRGKPRPGGDRIFTCDSRGEVFNPRIVALEFDEMGPGVSVNGDYQNSAERTRVDMVASEIIAPGGEAELATGAEEDENNQEDQRIGDLVNLTGPTWLEEGQAGMFRAPMRGGELEDAMADILDKMDELAEKMVGGMDADFRGGYLLDDEYMAKLTGEFMEDRRIRLLLDKIERMFIWKPGRARATVWFLDEEDGVIDEIPITFELKEEDSQKLSENIRIMAANSLRAELGLDLLEYGVVALEGSGEDYQA